MSTKRDIISVCWGSYFSSVATRCNDHAKAFNYQKFHRVSNIVQQGKSWVYYEVVTYEGTLGISTKVFKYL